MDSVQCSLLALFSYQKNFVHFPDERYNTYIPPQVIEPDEVRKESAAHSIFTFQEERLFSARRHACSAQSRSFVVLHSHDGRR